MSGPIELRGLRETDEALDRLGSVAGAKVMRQALFSATKPILDRAKSTIRSWAGGSGALFQAMGRTFRADKVDRGGSLEGGRFSIAIGPRIRNRAALALHNLYYRRQRRGIFYGHFLEFGHRIVHRYRSGVFSRFGREKRGIRVSGSVSPQRFLLPALTTGSARAVAEFRTQIMKRVARALKKQNPESEDA